MVNATPVDGKYRKIHESLVNARVWTEDIGKHIG